MIVESQLGKYWWVVGEHGVHLVMLIDGQYICSCAGFERSKRGECKHIKEVKEANK